MKDIHWQCTGEKAPMTETGKPLHLYYSQKYDLMSQRNTVSHSHSWKRLKYSLIDPCLVKMQGNGIFHVLINLEVPLFNKNEWDACPLTLHPCFLGPHE